MADFDVSTAQINSAGGGLGEVAKKLRSHLSNFQQELSGYGEPFGNDNIGRTIKQVYTPVHALGMMWFEKNVGDLEKNAAGLVKTAATYDKADQDSTNQIQSVARALDGTAVA
jgi:hypothetical protein